MFWAQKEGCGVEASCFSLLGRLWNRNVYFFGDVKQLALISVNNVVEILVKFPRVADFCLHTVILLMNATQMNILDATTSAK